jgi:hypothetical protein
MKPTKRIKATKDSKQKKYKTTKKEKELVQFWLRN